MQKMTCQFTCAEQKTPDNREVHRSFKKRGSFFTLLQLQSLSQS